MTDTETETELGDDELQRRLLAAFDQVGRRAPLARLEWEGPVTPSRVAASRRTARRLVLAGAAVAAALVVLAAAVIVGGDGGGRVEVGRPAPATEGPRQVALDQPPGPQGTWEPGRGAATKLGRLVELRADPVARASLAVKVGGGSRWVWVVAGAEDGRLRSALDSSVSAPGALSAGGGQLAVAFPGLVKIVDLATGAARDLPSALAGGDAHSVTWSPDGSRLAVLRTEGGAPPEPPGPSVVEVLGLDGSVRRFTAAGTPREVSWSPDGGRLLTVGTLVDGRLDGRGEVVDVAAGTSSAIPAGPGALVGWYDDRTLLRSQAGSPGEQAPPAPGGSTTTTTVNAPGLTQGAVLFLDLAGNVMRRLDTVDGILDQRAEPLDPSRRYGLLTPLSSGLGQVYAAVVDLQTAETVGRVSDQRAIPYVLGLANGTLIEAVELDGRFEVRAVDWSTGRETPIAVLPFRDEGFTFAPGQSALPR